MATDRINVPLDLKHVSQSELEDFKARLVSSKQDIEAQLGVERCSDRKKGSEWRTRALLAKRSIENDLSRIKLELKHRHGKPTKRPSYLPLLADFLLAIEQGKGYKDQAKKLRELLETHYQV